MSLYSDLNEVLTPYAQKIKGKADLPSNGYGSSGKVLRSTGTGTEWAEVGQPTDEQTNEAVSNWLDEHPEATTTIPDAAITEEKINISFLQKIKNGYVTPEMFGAKGDGVADDTNALSQALTYPVVYIPSGKYLITGPLISNSKRILSDKGAVISYNGNEGIVLSLSGDSVEVNGLTIDGNRKASKGIAATAQDAIAENICIKNCVCKNFDNGNNAVSSAGIYILRNVSHVKVEGCTVENIYRTTGQSAKVASVGIAVLSINGTCEISNNIINGVYFDSTVKTDADGIEVFSYNALTQGVKNISIQVSNNIITQSQGRFIKCQGDNLVIKDNTLLNSDLELIDNFRGIDLQTGKGTVEGNRIYVSGRTSGNIATSALISWTSRDYTANYAQCTIKNNDLVNDVQGGYGVILMPYDILTTVVAIGNNLINFNFGFEFANSDSLLKSISLIICQNWFNNVAYGHRIRTTTSNVTQIIENNYGYIYENSDGEAQSVNRKIKIQMGKTITIPKTVTSVRNMLIALYDEFTEIGNYVFQVTWTGHGTYLGTASIFTSTTGMLSVVTGGYMYVLNHAGADDSNKYAYVYNNSGTLV